MAKKYYGIKKGFDSKENKAVENIFVETWDECLSYVKGVKGAIYKSFQSLDEVKMYLSDDTRILKKGIDKYPLDVPHAYVDGSFNTATGKYGYGVVIIFNGSIIHLESGTAENDSEKSLRQIAGELKGAVRAAQFAVDKKFKEIVIFHDYEGICHHATGSWERKDKSSQEYFEKMKYIREINNLNIIFVKVDSHTNDLFNELADEGAKKGAGLCPNGAVEKLIRNTKIKVNSGDVKDKLLDLISENNCDNIIVEESYNTLNEFSQSIVENILQLENEDDLMKYIEKLKDSEKKSLIKELWMRVKENYI